MKTFRLYLTLCLFVATMTASAQFANSTSAPSPSGSSSANTEEWSGLRLSYNPMTMSTDVKGFDDWDFTGLSIGYVTGISISKTMPLFVETGVHLQWMHYNESSSDDDYEETVNMYSISIPANLTYRYSVNENFSLLPYVGLNFRGNLSGTLTTDDGDDEEEIDLFDKKDMGSSDNTWSRFQVGWQIGIGANLGDKFYASVGYGSDFSEIWKEMKAKLSTTSITVGFNF